MSDLLWLKDPEFSHQYAVTNNPNGDGALILVYYKGEIETVPHGETPTIYKTRGKAYEEIEAIMRKNLNI